MLEGPLDTTVFGEDKPQTGLRQNWAAYQARVNRYDQAASPEPPGFLQNWGWSTAKWGTRVSLGKLGDSLFTVNPNNPYLSQFSNRCAGLADQAVGYDDLFNIRASLVNSNLSTNSFKFFQKAENRQEYSKRLNDNFKNIFQGEFSEKPIVSNYFKKTVAGQYVGGLYDAASNGKVCTLLARLAGAGLAIKNIVGKTFKAYNQAQAQCDGSKLGEITVLASTAKTCAVETAKGLVCWELGNIGLVLANGLICIGGWPRLVGGWVIGSLLSTLGHQCLSKLLPDP